MRPNDHQGELLYLPQMNMYSLMKTYIPMVEWQNKPREVKWTRVLLLNHYLSEELNQEVVYWLELTDYDIDAQFIGCYRWGIQDGGDYTRSGGMTIDLCTETCRRYMKTYAALQNGSVCRCSNDVIRHHPVDECHVTCSGHPQQYCGGRNGSMSVFASCPIGFYGDSCSLDCNCLNRTQCDIRTGDCPNGCEPDWSGSKCDTSTGDFSISPIYMGCWKDNHPTSRDFESENFHFQATVETCSVFCRRKKYTYMGLQYYSECFCGNSFGQFGRSPEAECNQPCHQNRSQMCGGGNRNSVYAVCPIGFFGDACTQACHCTKGVRCFVANGTCISGGCAQGWNGQACNIKDHSCSKGTGCKPDETCKMYDLKFTQVSRCECRGGYVRPGTWSTCIGLEECRIRKDCNSILNIDSTGIDDDPGTLPLAQPLKENADYDAGSRISVLIAFLVISLIANVALIAFLIFRTRLDTVWNPYARHLADGDSNSM